MSSLLHFDHSAPFWPAPPGWAVTGRTADPEAAAFRAGAALAHLQGAMAQSGLPLALWRDRAIRSGRRARSAKPGSAR